MSTHNTQHGWTLDLDATRTASALHAAQMAAQDQRAWGAFDMYKTELERLLDGLERVHGCVRVEYVSDCEARVLVAAIA